MYFPFLLYSYAASLLLLIAGIRIVDRSIPGLRGVRPLIWSAALGSVALVLTGLRQWAPDWLTIVAANAMFFAEALLLYCSVAEVLKCSRRWLGTGIALAAAGMLADGWFTYIAPSLLARVLLFSGILMTINAATARLLFRNRNAAVRTPARGLAWMFAASAAAHLARCVLSLRLQPANLVHVDMLQAAFSHIVISLALAAGAGLVWLAACMHRQELYLLAHTDALTGLPNRRAFEETLERELLRCTLTGRSAAAMLIDIDHFKQINDVWGHAAGDETLRRFGAVLQATVRNSDTAARWGGEEFAVLLSETAGEEAEQIAERLRAAVAASQVSPAATALTASIGLAMSIDGELPHDLLRRCDIALYCSKRAGRNVVTVHGQEGTRGIGFGAAGLSASAAQL
ncbi:MAG TPA: GGDEF domain-containing protein [Terracidiphilus sp.]|nr:GGDEF domain-containing protein [Terracidiphilus sp.]